MSFDYILGILDDAAISEEKVTVVTKERGKIIGMPHSTDYFETDDERLGYFIEIGENLLDTVYLDEIAEITVHREDITIDVIKTGLSRASGK